MESTRAEGTNEITLDPGVEMTHVLLIGADVALLEGIAQTLAAQGHQPTVARTLAEGREVAGANPPLVLVADRTMVSGTGGELLTIAVAAGGARLLYRGASVPPAPLLPALQRAVLADLTLPLERHRLTALVQSISERARTTGRAERQSPTEGRAS